MRYKQSLRINWNWFKPLTKLKMTPKMHSNQGKAKRSKFNNKSHFKKIF